MARVSSFFLKIFSGFLLIIVLLLVVTLFSSFKVLKSNYINNLKDKLEKINTVLSDETIEHIGSGDIDNYIKSTGKQLNIRITVIDNDGVVLGDSEHDPVQMENHRYRKEIDYAFQTKETGSTLRYSNTLKKEMLYVANVLVSDDKVIGVIRTSMFLENIRETIAELRSKLIRGSYFVFFISLIVAIFISQSVSRPVLQLRNAALNVSRGDFSTKVNIPQKGDFRTFANSFNEMTERIQNLFGRIEDEKERLKCLLQSIKEGIVVLDSNGEIIMANPEMIKITGQELQGKKYWEIFKAPIFKDKIERLKKNEQISLQAVKLDDRDFIFSLSKVEPKGDIIFSLKNISEIKELEQIKKDFVSNVSHELRTPLTAIKGFVETLQEEETDETKKYYFEILEKHTDRLINIVKDLLALSNLESTRSKLDIEKIPIKTLISDVEKVVDVKIKSKNLLFEIDIDPEVPEIDGDRFKLEQLLINLIDNAAKYTDEGKISVITKKLENQIQIIIKDTGIGIPQKHLSRIFERFYVVDKSRSRKMGGTGLGLSIVKHIVMQHKGHLDVKSEQNEGTEFIIDLPIEQITS